LSGFQIQEALRLTSHKTSILVLSTSLSRFTSRSLEGHALCTKASHPVRRLSCPIHRNDLSRMYHLHSKALCCFCEVSVLQKVAGSGPAVNTLQYVDRAPGYGISSLFIIYLLAHNNATCPLRPAYRLPLDKKISLFLVPYGSYFELEKCSILHETIEI